MGLSDTLFLVAERLAGGFGKASRIESWVGKLLTNQKGNDLGGSDPLWWVGEPSCKKMEWSVAFWTHIVIYKAISS